MRSDLQRVQGWGRYNGTELTAYMAATLDELATAELPTKDLIARGLGRSYGDAAQRAGGSAVLSTACTRAHWVDREAGVIRAEAGVSIGQLINRFAPKGWFVPVTPGTRQVTIGGAIAADIHGKNHHVDGSFGEHVRSLRLRLANDDIVTLSPTKEPEAFWATVGGMGLTGVILDAEIQMHPIETTMVAVETQRLHELDTLLYEMQRSDDQHAFSVAWVDLLGDARSVLTQGSFATPQKLVEITGSPDPAGPLQRPPTPMVSLPPLPLPRVAITPGVKAFNELWWRKAPAQPTITAESITAFFHPLDAISDWNRVYGGGGFVQWQCVIPDEANAALQQLVAKFADLPAYFTVLKRFGAANPSPLSFPAPGWTLAVDLPATAKALRGLPELDQIVADAGGRIYLAKDARLDRRLLATMYPRLDEFKAIRNQLDPNKRFLSDLADRLGL